MNSAVAVLAAIAFAGSASAGPMLCADVSSRVAAPTACDGKDPHRIDLLLHSTKQWRTDLWTPLGTSHSWIFGSVNIHDARWIHRPSYDKPPSRNVPEPGSLALLGIGVVGLVWSRRRKRA